MAEANEPPREAAKREVREELGIEYAGGRLLVVDWVSPHGPWDDSLMFIFDGGVLGEEEHAGMTLPDGELRAWRFAELDEAATLLRGYAWRRVQAAMTSVVVAAA